MYYVPRQQIIEKRVVAVADVSDPERGKARSNAGEIRINRVLEAG